jgi:hypothetical protein
VRRRGREEMGHGLERPTPYGAECRDATEQACTRQAFAVDGTRVGACTQTAAPNNPGCNRESVKVLDAAPQTPVAQFFPPATASRRTIRTRWQFGCYRESTGTILSGSGRNCLTIRLRRMPSLYPFRAVDACWQSSWGFPKWELRTLINFDDYFPWTFRQRRIVETLQFARRFLLANEL